jgi:hypothetical protein
MLAEVGLRVGKIGLGFGGSHDSGMKTEEGSATQSEVMSIFGMQAVGAKDPGLSESPVLHAKSA